MFRVTFPEPRVDVVVETPLMERTARRTMAVHSAGALVVWAGPSRVGKTWTARWLRDSINAAYGTDANAFRAVHYETGSLGESSNTLKQGIRSLYHACIGPMTSTGYRNSTDEELARQLVYGLQARNTQMIFVDEAGLLSLNAIRGMVLARDTAENEGFPLSIVFIGMDDLPTTIRRLPQVENRVHEWCYFEAYAPEEIWDLAAELHPHFEALELDSPAAVEQSAILYEITQGLPGKLAPFLNKLSVRHHDEEIVIDATFLRAVHLMTMRDRQRTVDDADARRGTTVGNASTKPESHGAKTTRRTRKKKSAEPPRTARGKRPRTGSSSTPED